MNFSELNLLPSLMEALDAMNFEKATPIQQQAIPIILDRKDLIACAQTGTGKTAAFLLPILNRLAAAVQQNKTHFINTLILAPTRELALQIDQQVEGFSYFLGVSSMSIYGGGDGPGWDQQKQALIKGTDIIIATPGRLIQHINMGYVNFNHVEHLVLDEADRMLDMGFYDDIMNIVSKLPQKRQTLLFSATMPDKIRQLTKRILNQPEQISIAISKPAEGVLQGAYLVYDKNKIGLIKYLLTGKKNYQSVIIFASTKQMVREINDALKRGGFASAFISSDLEQQAREDALLDFKNKKLQILVATDILARGIDIKEISLVINYDVPGDAEDYVHRVGRTARADATGVALTFINEKDQRKFKDIETLIGQDVMKISAPPELGDSPAYEPEKRRSFEPNKNGGSRRPNNNRNKKTSADMARKSPPKK